jgi:hypothetical protein
VHEQLARQLGHARTACHLQIERLGRAALVQLFDRAERESL